MEAEANQRLPSLLAAEVRELGSYFAATKATRFRATRLFPFCVRSSAIKCYELLECCFAGEKDATFFLVPSLRGICEDFITLGYLRTQSHDDRQELLHLLMLHNVVVRTETQRAFFAEARPMQPSPGFSDSGARRAELEKEIQSVWSRFGWNLGGTRVLPPTRDLAERQGAQVLLLLYEFLFRFTSSAVHFSPQDLLRAGWGSARSRVTISTNNFASYYHSIVTTYGGMLLTTYFEMFRRQLRPNQQTRAKVANLRQALLQLPRWPELVTFEELNLEPPAVSALQVAGIVITEEKYRAGFLTPKDL